MKTTAMLKKYKLSFFSIIIFVFAWEIISAYKVVNPLFASSPTKIFSTGYDMIFSGEIFPHFFVSMESLFLGLFLAIIFGVVIGLIVGFFDAVYDIFYPYILILNSLPIVAIIPLIIIWFGIGIQSKIIIVFMMSIKPILINTVDSVRKMDKDLLIMSKSFGATDFQLIKWVIFFGSLPFIFSSFQIAVGRGIIGLVVGEMFGYGKGLGFLVSFYGATFQTGKLMFVVIFLLAISLAVSKFIYAVERKMIKWRN